MHFQDYRPNHAREMRSSSFDDGRRFIILAHFFQIFREFDKKSEKKTGFSKKTQKKSKITLNLLPKIPILKYKG